ncbi:MAG: hypothetical protein V3S56_05480, partial [Gemmatimonadota bacterium]
MQTLTWYWRRLRAMPPGEVGWRIGGKVQESLDLCVARLRERPPAVLQIANGNGSALDTRSTGLVEPGPASARDSTPTALNPRSESELIAR